MLTPLERKPDLSLPPRIVAWRHEDNANAAKKQEVSVEQLRALGVELSHFPTTPDTLEERLELLSNHKGYVHRDMLILSHDTDVDGWLPRIWAEHMHPDDEIRYVLEGDAYMDVRDRDDNWVRFHLVPGILLVVPAGIYHRFKLTEGDYVKIVRLFKSKAGWISTNRSAESDQDQAHRTYLKMFPKNQSGCKDN
ncbi:1,2-dihydroxy-3-keto-5-methylthiopentene dioxygenase [Geranomyces variabilis]|uniref:acireductone dioxygenase (Fe(2+)-requiring) n=1 Tax=Geranomyces variabilis TaxID=109894 RepID=A0AAD5TL90_9FUNG|nr:1,2-dihydroxy-3-keto-5-methylthiopentene dioxygenase [Geranomyces variabilis]